MDNNAWVAWAIQQNLLGGISVWRISSAKFLKLIVVWVRKIAV